MSGLADKLNSAGNQQSHETSNQHQYQQSQQHGGGGGFMSGLSDKLSGGGGGANHQSSSHQDSNQNQQHGSGGFMSGLGEKLHGAVGGGRESEKNEDMLDKGIDFFQEKVLHQGPQDNESALEQAKDKQIANMIRGKYKDLSGKEFPIKEKQHQTKFF